MGEGKKVYIYNTPDLAKPQSVEPATVLEADTKSVSMVWSPDGSKLALGAWYETIVIDIKSNKKISKF